MDDTAATIVACLTLSLVCLTLMGFRPRWDTNIERHFTYVGVVVSLAAFFLVGWLLSGAPR